ncbi:MAG: ABC transporter substrate-binding protein [Thermoleophilaceae bacterium]
MRNRFGRAAMLSLAALLLAASLAVAGCGDDDDDGGGNGEASQNLQALKVGIPTVASDFTSYVADSQGFFEEEGLDVTIQDGTAANTASLVSSGDVDIAQFAAATPLVVSAQGRQTSIIYGLSGGGQGGSIIGAPGEVDTIEKFRELSDCRIGTFPPGSSAYGYAALYNENLDLGCDLVPFQDAPSQIAALAANRVDVIVGALGNWTEALGDEQVVLLMDSRDPDQREEFIGEPFPETVFWGIAETLESKRESVAAFLSGIDKARQFLQDSSTEEIAEAVSEYESFSSLPEAALHNGIETFKAYVGVGSDDGFITEDQWSVGLERYALWGLPRFDAQADSNSYENAVDMSYYTDGIGEPGGS